MLRTRDEEMQQIVILDTVRKQLNDLEKECKSHNETACGPI
jgi:hypothetical protein